MASMGALARFGAISLGLGAGGAVAAVATMLPNNPVSALLLPASQEGFTFCNPRLEGEGSRRRSRVLEEVERSAESYWAGVYRTAGAWPNELAIAPEAGFTLYHNSRCGNCARFVGLGSVLSAEESTLKLRVEVQEPDDTSEAWYGLDDTLHLVPWGELVFAVAESRMESFCAAVSDGSTFPSIPYRYTGAGGDFDRERPSRPAGKPRVPPAYAHLILDAPISCRIAALDEWRRRPQLDGKEREAYDAVYSVDSGSSDGLAVGMRLFVEGETRWGRFTGRVEQVDREVSRFQVLAFEDERDWVDNLVGKRATTRHPRAVER
jgi:hypothetical protein